MKKPDIKALMIEHGEKIALGLFATISLGVLATTSWSTYEKSPDTLKLNAENARKKFTSPENVWVEENSFKVVDFSEKAKQLFTPLAPIAVSRYEISSTPLFYPIYKRQEPRKEPNYEPVQYLISDDGFFALSMLANPDAPVINEATPKESETAPSDDEFAERPVPGNVAGTGAALTAPSIVAGTGTGAAHGSGKASTKGSAKSSSGSAHGAPKSSSPSLTPSLGLPPAMGSSMMSSMMMGPAAMGGGAGGNTSDVKVVGKRFIAVRGIFDIERQRKNYAKSLNVPEAEAARLVEITHFILERQTAKAGADPWKDSEWDVVDISNGEKVLLECSEVDQRDPVPERLKSPVITMELPLRMNKNWGWGKFATHPKIKEYELNAAQIEEEAKVLEALATAAGSLSADQPKPTQKRGLSRASADFKGMANKVQQSSKGMEMMKDAYASMKPPGGSSAPSGMAMPGMNSSPSGPPPSSLGMGGSGMGSMGMGSMGMGSMMMGAGGARGGSEITHLVDGAKLVLFRYFDFDVQPGMAYRYRVRLELQNPNYNLPPEQLVADVEITKGETRKTPPSNISNPSVVPITDRYFLTDVAQDPYREEKRVRSEEIKPVVQMTMFNWDTNFGTVVTDTLGMPAIGSFVGGLKKETVILDLVEEALIKKKHQYATEDLIVDVIPDMEVKPEDHPDLKLTVPKGQGKAARIGRVEEALVATKLGEIKALDPVSEAAELAQWKKRVEGERKSFHEHKEGDTPKNGGRLDSKSLEGGAKADGDSDKKSKKRSIRRAQMSPASMMSSMMPAQSTPSQPERRSKPPAR